MSPLAKTVEGLSYRHQRWQVWSDFVEMAAISLSNAVDLNQREKREARYMDIVRRYSPDEVAQFPRMMGELAVALEKGPADILGPVFGELELSNRWKGQFFTPPEVADMMARMVLLNAAELVKEKGYITLCEPAVGAGAMVIAACKALKAQGINYQRQFHATCTDVDQTAAYMAYIQLSLLSVPAIVEVGNSLTMETREVWYTPAHIFGLWSSKLRAHQKAEASVARGTSVGGVQPAALAQAELFA